MAAPPNFKVPPPPAKKQTGIAGKLDAMLQAHAPKLRGYEPFILKWASVYKVDPLYLAAVLATEDPSGDPTARSSAGAVGLAQIKDRGVNPKTNPNAVWDGPTTLSDQWKSVPNNAIKYLAWRMAGHIDQYGSLDGAYKQGYNPGYTGTLPSSFLPKGYVPTTGPGTQPTPAEGAGPSVAGTNAKHALTDPWVIVGKNGQIHTSKIANAPANTLKAPDGTPVTLSQFNSVGRSLDTIYEAYTGVRATTKAILAYIRSPVSDYEIQQRLSNPKLNPRFYKSPVWLTHAPDYEAVYKQIYGNDAKPSRDAIRYGVVHNLSQTGFSEYLRNLPGYSNSEEYKGAAASFRSGYESIYGTPDATGEQHIDAAVRQGWNQDQWMQYLRSQPEYKSSGEFQANIYNLFNRLGFQTKGQQIGMPTSLNAGAAPTPAPSATATGSGVSG